MKEHKKSGVGLGVAAGIVASVAAAAGAYFLYGTKEGAKAKKKIKAWSVKAKGEVLEKIEKMKDVTEDSYNQAVASVMDKYKKTMKEHGDDVDAVKKELHGYWKQLKGHVNKAAEKGKKIAKKVTK